MSSTLWVESYLEQLMLRENLQSLPTSSPSENAPSELLPSESSVLKNFYVQQVLSMDEDSVRCAWARANAAQRLSTAESSPPATRLSNSLWRVWFVKSKCVSLRDRPLRR
jgi:hypothetical protein